MILKSLTIEQYRGFASRTSIEFDPSFTLIVGENGVGKTSVLWALRVLLSRTLARLVKRPAKNLLFQPEDITRGWPYLRFVSPLRPGCEERFSFTLNGEIRASSPTDAAATKTIEQLGLDHALMKQFRKAAIEATLGIRGRGHASLDLHSARARLNSLRAAEQNRSPLEPFCFVLKQALQRHITRIEAIRESKRGQR